MALEFVFGHRRPAFDLGVGGLLVQLVVGRRARTIAEVLGTASREGIREFCQPTAIEMCTKRRQDTGLLFLDVDA